MEDMGHGAAEEKVSLREMGLISSSGRRIDPAGSGSTVDLTQRTRNPSRYNPAAALATDTLLTRSIKSRARLADIWYRAVEIGECGFAERQTRIQPNCADRIKRKKKTIKQPELLEFVVSVWREMTIIIST